MAPQWKIRLLDDVRIKVLRETCDFLLKENLAIEYGMNERDIGQCLSILVSEGLLEFKPIMPSKDDSFIYKGVLVKWVDNQWIAVDPDHLFGYRNEHKVKSEFIVTKNKKGKGYRYVLPSIGKVYYIRRDVQFRKACNKAGVPDNPFTDWECPICQSKNKCDDLYCRRSHNYCGYKRPSLLFWPVPPKDPKICYRCGTLLDGSQKIHSKFVCNNRIVQDINES